MSLQPWKQNPSFWQYNGKPVLLLGGSVEDNLFQIDGLEAHLDTLAACGGNYVRCSMSARDEGNAWYFQKDPKTGLYDLEQAEGPYWDRFETFIQLTRERDIIVQIEVFDRFDFAREPWRDNPFNPRKNINYDEAASGLATQYPKHPGARENPFFRSVPALEDNPLLRRCQESFVDRLLSVTLGQPHVLYCISNETNESPEWGKYWAEYIQSVAEKRNRTVQVTEMWDAHDLDDRQHRFTWEHPETYAFVDVSQVNHQTGQAHWDQLMAFRETIATTGHQRPLNSVKVYGANSGYYGTTRDGQERFWRNVFAGLAGVRFHRPASGLGLSHIARANIRAARMLASKIDLFACKPNAARLLERSRNEAYCTGIRDQAYAVYFPDGGNVLLQAESTLSHVVARVQWLDIRLTLWHEPVPANFDAEGRLRLKTPVEEGYWACVVEVT
ncbi:MAG: hypothetical protein ACP5I4_09265 [Oceanipulchritudo sp.]